MVEIVRERPSADLEKVNRVFEPDRVYQFLIRGYIAAHNVNRAFNLHFTALLLPLLNAGITIPPALPRLQSIVGYTTDNSVTKGHSLLTPNFLSVGSTAANVTDLVPGNLGEYINGEVNFESLDSFGRSVEGSTYQYFGYDGMTGWYDGEFAEGDKTFGACEAVWLAMPGEDGATTSPVTLTDAGQVNVDDVTLTMAAGHTALGNMMAVDYPISDIEVGNLGDNINGEVNFESLDSFGRSVEGSTYQYFGYDGMTGWYDGEFNPADASLNPGQGIWFASPAGVTLKFYAPDL